MKDRHIKCINSFKFDNVCDVLVENVLTPRAMRYSKINFLHLEIVTIYYIIN